MAPFLLPLKLLIQRLTKMGLAWDAEIPELDKTVCNKLINTLLNLNNIVIPRCFIPTQYVEVIKGAQLHVFADASVDGIGAVFANIYWKSLCCVICYGKITCVAVKTDVNSTARALCGGDCSAPR